ncbi:flagellar hook protein FlgE [Pseudactinotalea terrae]|uniref:flagellar hook protein FlgE n=1 Tax=Pseudactinotalea terrae TaxID=1743262 RepID=UPI0012E1C910|nr:flagellar hook protein FlgE [Pseudactinotalea terrae]
MLRSLTSGITGLRAHQQMLDVTGNNIANVNTTAFKAAQTRFQDTLSQLVENANSPQQQAGGTNPAQIGLGVQVAAIATNFTQGAPQPTGRASDMMISGDGFFVVRSGNETLYTRAGAFDFDAQGRLVTSDGAFVRGWSAVNGVVNPNGPLSDLTLPVGALAGAEATTSVILGGNLPSDAEEGAEVVRDVEVFDDLGVARRLTLTFTQTAGQWLVEGTDGAATAPAQPLTFTAGALTGGGTMTVGGVTVDLTALTGYADLSTVEVTDSDGRAAGELESFSLAPDGTLVGAFSNGVKEPVGRIALAGFTNPGGLEKAGGSGYRASANSGDAVLGVPGDGGLGSLVGGALEMSNVDLSQEFTNLIVAQRGFQANSRIITTSDQVLDELVNLKR